MGDCPLTVIVSDSAPTLSDASIVAVKLEGSWIPSRATLLKPSNENVTV
jgi:hypothetical protein